MLSISNDQDNANQNHNEKSSHSFRTSITEREGEREVWGRSVVKDVEKRKSLYTAGVKSIQQLEKTVWTVIKEFKI